MKADVAFLIFFLVVQVCRSATVSEAETKLEQLRELTSTALREANAQHSRMSGEIDKTTLSTKRYGWSEIKKKTDRFLAKLKADNARTHLCRGSRDYIANHLRKLHSQRLEDCVNENGKDGVDLIARHKLEINRYVSRAIDNDEKQVLECGENEECLEKVVANINDQLAEVRHVIADEIKIKEHNKENQLEHIRNCASKSITDIELELNQTPTCVY